MDASLLQQLLTKPIPKKHRQIEIRLPQKGEVALQTKIIDKTNLGFDGVFFRRQLEKFEKVGRETTLEEAYEEPYLEEEEEVAAIESAEEEEEAAAEAVAESVEAAEIEAVEAEMAAVSAIKKKPKGKKRPRSKKEITVIERLERVSPPDLTLIVDKQGRTLAGRLPPPQEEILIQTPPYFLNNQRKFISFITNLFLPYRQQLIEEEGNISCDREDDFSLLTHQKIVRDYINIYTPYRGLLLYHGLGTGKTCSSIAIAEGLKNTRPIIIMTPASLQMNYIQELKKCGDILYKTNQYWEFISTLDNEPLAKAFSKILNLPLTYITEKGGAWLINIKRKSNYNLLNRTKKQSINEQVTMMINRKYYFINYNGLRKKSLQELKTKFGQPNIFDNAVVIIDEVHNFVSMIANKLKNKKSLSMKLYNYLQNAQNCRIIGLTGTPIINYPNELAILFNILRGYIITYTLPLTINTQQKINERKIKQILQEVTSIDYILYHASLKQLVITRNPFGFVNKNNGKTQGLKQLNPEMGNIQWKAKSDRNFIKKIIQILAKNQIIVNQKQITVRRESALPENLSTFSNWFIDGRTGLRSKIKISSRKRILGLTSHFQKSTGTTYGPIQ